MSEITLYGPSLSTYVRTARMTCEEKGVAYELKALQLGGDEHLLMHPFGKVPALTQGDFHLYETGAIARYIDRSFPGTKLQPEDNKQLAVMDQWVSAVGDYVYPLIIREIVLPRFGLKPMVAEAVQAAVPKVEQQLHVISKALDHTPFLAGAQLSLADLFLAPILFYLRMTPEGEMLSQYQPVTRWFETISSRKSFQATMPEMPKK